jgi:hypothetical protein
MFRRKFEEYNGTRILLLMSYFSWPILIELSRYNGRLQAERPRGRSLSTGWGKNFHFFVSFRPAFGSTQSSCQLTWGALSSGVKWPGREADHSPLIKKTWSIHPLPIRLHGIVLNDLSTGATLPLRFASYVFTRHMLPDSLCFLYVDNESAHMSLVDHSISQPSLDISPIWTLIIVTEVRKLQLCPV